MATKKKAKKARAVKRVAILTGGGDCPGLNAVIRAVAKPAMTSSCISPEKVEVYGFLDARDIAADTLITFLWLYEGAEAARLELTLKKGSRWRTYTSKRLGKRRGNWEVQLLDASGNILDSMKFTVR